MINAKLGAKSALLTLAVISLTGCPTPAKVTDIQGLKNCVATDFLAGDQIRYMGPTTEGAGSLWIKIDNSNVAVGVPAASIVGNPPQANLVTPAAPGVKCDLSTAKTIDVTTSLGASIDLLPVSGDLKAGLKGSKIESVVVDGFQLEDVFILNYEAKLEEIAKGSPAIKSRIGNGEVLAAIRMVKVSSYTATLDTSSAVDAGVAIKYNGPLPGGVKGSLSPAVNVGTTTTGKLSLSIPGAVYVAGVFRPVALTGDAIKVQSASTQSTPKISLDEVLVIPAIVEGTRSGTPL